MNLKPWVILIAFILTSCSEEGGKDDDLAKIEPVIREIRETYAPDGRVALFEIRPEAEDNLIILKGETNLPEAKERLLAQLEQENVVFRDSIDVLPAAELGAAVFALANNSVINVRSEPKHAAELATQALLGTPLRVYQQQEEWFLVQTPDGYLGWVDAGGISRLSKEELEAWNNHEKIVYLEPHGVSYSAPEKTAGVVSDLVAGDILELKEVGEDFYKVEYPDERTAYVPRDEARPYRLWVGGLRPNEESLIEASKTMMGVPYLWGGTSGKGVDCSGFTKTVYFLNGMVIPRDASQQVHTGVLVDSVGDFSEHRPGDLLFFGRPATDSTEQRVVHVGMWIGDNKFIHSMGNVHISTFDKSDPAFDQYNFDRYLLTKRLLNSYNDPGIRRLDSTGLFLAPR